MMPSESTRAAALRARLDGGFVEHVRFTGPPVDFKDWASEELGAIWGALHRAARFGHDDPARRALAMALLAQASSVNLAPALAGDMFLDALDAARVHDWDYAIGCLACLRGAPPEGSAQLALRILDEPKHWGEQHFAAWLLAQLAGGDAPAQFGQMMDERHARYPMPLTLQELTVLPQLAQASLLALAGSRYSGHWNRDSIGEADPAEVLADDVAYVDFGRTILEQAARHIAAIHDGSVPYAADAAFATADSAVLARAARVASYRDDAWFRPAITVLLPLACVAPGAAKSAPSQSLAMALGHAVETVPTPESLLALREALAQVRHAGIRKKLERNLKPAERALAERPDIAWRIGMPGPMGRRRQAMLARRLEAGYASEVWFGLEQWRALRDDVDIDAVARALVWRTGDGLAFMLDGKGAIDAQGSQWICPGKARSACGIPCTAAGSSAPPGRRCSRGGACASRCARFIAKYMHHPATAVPHLLATSCRCTPCWDWRAAKAGAWTTMKACRASSVPGARRCASRDACIRGRAAPARQTGWRPRR
nr:hypothetical protein [Janthinobacterium sp. PAMC25594]